MARDMPNAQAILAHQITPALILNRSGTVVAANEGSVRLLLPFRQNASFATEGSLLGKSIADLALIPLPGASPVLRTWSSILAAAIDISESGAANRQSFRGYLSTTYLYQNTDDFWDDEAEQQAIIESDVHVARYSSQAGIPRANDSDDATSVVRARASVHWLSSNLDGVFLIIFNRTSLPHQTAPTSPAAVKDSINAFERQNDYQSLDSNDILDKTDASDVAYAIIPHIVATMDTDGQVVKLSKSWYSFSGLNEEQSLGSGWISTMFPDDVQEMTSAWADVIRHERSHWTHQARFRRASDGTFCWFLIRAEPYRDAKGNVLRWYVSMMDIHEWVVARLKADIRRQSIITLFAQTDVMLWGIDKTNQMYICEGRLKWDPSRVVKLLEGTRGEQDVPYIESPEETYRNPDQELVHTIQGVLKGRTFSPIVEHWEDDRYFRTRFVAEHVPPCVDGSATSEDVVQAALALTFDITEEKARSVLLTENKRLVAKEKAALDASNLKSRFLANMSHEIRTPISGIIGLSEHLSDCGLNEEQLEFSNSIEESAKFLLTLVNDVLDFSKMESGHMDIEQIPFSPYKLISDTLIPLRLQARERGLSLNFRCDLKPDALFLGDPWRLRQILTNLIGNSLKFTQEGHIALSVHEAEKKDNQVILKFVVKDSGVGISEETIKLLFKPFSQADGSTARLYGGTGLGLAICRQLVELMGGHIGLESVHAESTTATCRIPFQIYHGPTHGLLISTALPDRAQIHDPEEKANTKKARHLSPPDGTNGMTSEPFAITNTPGIGNHILLVEDNPINRKVISIALKKLGFVVSAVWNGQEALDFLCKKSTEPRPDVILMDCMMPVVDGYEATRRIRNDKTMFNEQVRELPIIALTASAIKGDRERCWDAGMDDYLTKPAARDELRRTLARWLVTPRIRGLDRSRLAD